MLSNFLAKLIRCNAARKDSDVCIEATKSWSGFNCMKSKTYCRNENYAKDPRRCCPETCELSEPFTKEKCMASSIGGHCTYPFYTHPQDCKEGMGSSISTSITYLYNHYFYLSFLICFNTSFVTIGFDLDLNFRLSGNGTLCSESGFQIIDDFNTCRSAAEFFGKTIGEYETVDNYPRGCYLERNDHVYFNNHEIGEKIHFAKPICSEKGMLISKMCYKFLTDGMKNPWG